MADISTVVWLQSVKSAKIRARQMEEWDNEQIDRKINPQMDNVQTK